MTAPKATGEIGLDGGAIDGETESAIRRSSGQALDDGTRQSMEGAFGTDFSNVRIHTGSNADNLNTKIFMRVNDPLTARYVSESSGTRRKYDPFLQLGGGITMRCAEEAAVLPEDVLNLKKRIFYLFGINGRYKGKTELVKPSRLKVEYPDIISKAV